MSNVQTQISIIIRHDNGDGTISTDCAFTKHDDAIKCCRKFNKEYGCEVMLTEEGDIIESDENYQIMYNDTSIWYEVEQIPLNSEFEG